MWVRWLSVFVVGVGCLSVAERAEAWPTYPGAIATHLNMKCPPPCVLCHTRPEGGRDYLQEEGGFYVDLIWSSPGGVPYRPTAGVAKENDIVQLVDLLETSPCQVATDKNFGSAPCDPRR